MNGDLAAFLHRHVRSLLLIAGALAVAGLIAAFSLPVGLFPQISFPRIVVDLDAGDQPADQTQMLVTRPVEELLRALPGVQDVRSDTTRGSAQIALDFGWGHDMNQATLLVGQALAQAQAELPAGISYQVRRMEPTVYPIIAYALQSDRLSPVALRDLADLRIVPLLAGVNGLARVAVQGGETAEIQVLADARRLQFYGLTMADLAAALKAGNVLQAVGKLQDHNKLYLVVSQSGLASAADIGQLAIKTGQGGVVRLRDVATVRDGVVPQWQRISEDGKPAVLFNIYEQPDGNAVRIARDVRSKLAGLALPAGVRLVCWYDQSELIADQAASVRDAVLIGLVLAGLVLLVFLRSLRLTLVAALAVPGVLAITVLLLSWFGQSFNIMTLGGIAAAVGLVIDDVIVMVEHIARRAAEQGRGFKILAAAGEFFKPLLGSSLATLIVFLPLGLLDGVTGAFSRALSITMAAALAVSWLVALLVVPILVELGVDLSRRHDRSDHGSRLARVHHRLLLGLFRRPLLLVPVFVPLLALGVAAYRAVPTGFMPQIDESGFILDYYAPSGTSLPETDRIAGQLDAILAAEPEVRTFSRRLANSLGDDLGETYHGDYFIRLKPGHRRSTAAVMQDVEAKVAARIPGLDIETAQLTEDLIGDLTAVPEPVEIKLFGADQGQLQRLAPRIADGLGKLTGLTGIDNGVRQAGDAINFRIDPRLAAIEGMDAQAITDQVDLALTGAVATRLPGAVKTVGVRVIAANAAGATDQQLAGMPIVAPDGHVFPLRRVARFATEAGTPELTRENLQPMVAVTAQVEGEGIDAAIRAIKNLLARPGMIPAGVRYELGGLYAQQQAAFVGLAKVFAAAAMAELILLMLLYENFAIAFIVLGSALFSASAVFAGLWLTGVELNITAMMGMTMIIGMGCEMAIFYLSEFEALRPSLGWREALIQAAANRLRPIAMTTLAAILTLLPLAFALGAGAGMQQPLAIAIIAGLLVQFPMVLLVMPVLIALIGPKPARSLIAGAD